MVKMVLYVALSQEIPLSCVDEVLLMMVMLLVGFALENGTLKWNGYLLQVRIDPIPANTTR